MKFSSMKSTHIAVWLSPPPTSRTLPPDAVPCSISFLSCGWLDCFTSHSQVYPGWSLCQNAPPFLRQRNSSGCSLHSVCSSISPSHLLFTVAVLPQHVSIRSLLQNPNLGNSFLSFYHGRFQTGGLEGCLCSPSLLPGPPPIPRMLFFLLIPYSQALHLLPDGGCAALS